ncbi:hypothetical protein BIW11_05880 [Tropilaelaps mercedesae]|uniref:Protein takeout-like n=1 Tax=Tropilaelaps mercedesae TaxID=418985 RepID=A0A1V9Y0J0_9ACAR|nr:hypothetical protein BIW11_05880 [Tropilaelaps mercedesae]
MKHFVYAGALFVVVLATNAWASTQEDANRFMDDLLGQRLRIETLRYQLDGMPLDDFKFKIKKELELGILPTHRDIKANFTNGMLLGLTSLRRRSGCNPTAYVQNSIVLLCPIDLSNVVEAKYTSFVKGFNVIGQVKEIEVKVKVIDTFINFEIQEEQNQRPSVKTFHIDKLRTLVEMPDIGFNEERQAKFKEEIDKNVHPLIFNAITGKLLEAFNSALRQDGVKLPVV